MDSVDWTTVIVTIVVAIFSGGAASAFITTKASKRSQDATALSEVTTAHSNLSKDLEEVRNARRKDKADFEMALEKMQTKYDVAVDVLKVNYAALDCRFESMEKERDKLLYEIWELKKSQNKAGGG